jgi:phage terminase large subunit GpA-like protein
MQLDAVKRNVLAQWAPPPRLKLDEWIEANVVLPSSIAALPGPVRLHPYMREIAASIGDPLIERVTLVKASRLGFTTLLTAAVGAYAANDPCPLIVLLPAQDDCRNYVVDSIEPTFAESPSLRDLFAPENDEFGRATLLHKRFPGGSLRVIPARSPRNLRAHTAKVLLCDEIDAYTPTEEGDAVRLAIQRTLSFSRRKIVLGSTPVHAETSAILAAYEQSDKRAYECPCPHCGSFFEIMWAHITWPPDEPEKATCTCPHCRQLIEERYKPQMVGRGVWRATAPAIVGHAGYRLSALVSLLSNASWAKLAAEFLAAKDHPDLLQPFCNTVLAEGWSGPGGDLQEDKLQARAEPFSLDKIPPEVLSLTVGSDVQDDRIEASVLGWTKTGECLILSHQIIWGSFADAETWHEFDDGILKSRWQHPYGGRLKIDAAVIDAGDGDHFDHVVAFCVPRARNRVFAGKGMFGSRSGFQMAKGRRIAGKLAIIGVDVLKSVIFDRLARGQGIRFSETLEPAYYEQLASQRRVTKYYRGMPTRRFEMVSTRARKESLDCVCYGWAARQALGNINFAMREERLKNPATRRESVAALIAAQLPH